MMKSVNKCLCCLRRPPEKDLSTPYPRLGGTEIYSDMLEYCFQIQLVAGGGAGGICEDCVGQLRDARDFKLQVECSQARLQARRRTWRPLQDEAPSCLLETGDNEIAEESPSREDEDRPLEVEDSEDELYDAEPRVKAEADSGDEASDEVSSAARLQLAMACCVRLERLPSPAPRAEHARGAPPTVGEPYSCFLCKKQFTDINDLVLHTRTHTVQKPYSCQVCYESFSMETHLNLHTLLHSVKRKEIVTPDKYYQCDICKKKYKHKASLLYHISLHTGQNLHSCDVCDKTFPLIRSLIVHKRFHTGERPFSCDECSNSFRTRAVLNMHKRRHALVKPYTCDVCKAQLMRKSSLVEHMTRHAGQEPYTCKVCNKKFTRKKYLTRHEKIHTRLEQLDVGRECRINSSI